MVNSKSGAGDRPVQARSRRTRAAILDAARAMAAAGGLGALRAERLAQAAGIAKGTVFAHFPDMERLVAALVAEGLAGLPAPAAPSDLPGLIEAQRPLLAFMAGQPQVVAALARFSGPEGEGLGLDTAICARIEGLAGAIAALQARGAVGPGDPGLLAEGLMAFAFHAAATSLCAAGPGEPASGDAAMALFARMAGRWLSPRA